MKNPLKKILVVLVIVFFIPAGIITVFEISKLDENEEIINTAYKNQLESIVISLNSYTQDIASNWASRIELAVGLNAGTQSSDLDRLVTENSAIKSVYIVKPDGSVASIYKTDSSEFNKDKLTAIIKSHSDEIKHLKTYFKSGYRKTASVDVDTTNSLIYFIGNGKNDSVVVCFIEVNLPVFLTNQVASRVQSIARENIIITLQDTNLNQVIYSTLRELPDNITYDFTGQLWLFPKIQIEISLKQLTISTLAKQRATQSMWLIGFLALFLIGGIWFLYSSIKHEVQLAQIKSEFISNVSHEIRTPLSLISMYIETLEMGRVKSMDKIHEYYQIISTETQRLIVIVNKILNFSKMEKGKRQFSLSPCNLNVITREVLDTYEFHLKAKEFSYSFEPMNHIPPIQCDKEAISEAIINLIDNAIKYSRDKKIIEIKTGTEGNSSFIEVKDFGLGISKKHQKLIFDKFYRVTNENLAYKAKGTGLGLAIVDEIVKTHKGRITLQSKIDEGSTFRLYFPILPNHIKTANNDKNTDS